MNYKKIDTVDLDKIKKELSDIKFTRTYALQGTVKDEDPLKYIIPDDGSVNAWQRSPKGMTAKDLTVTLFDTPYINSLLEKFQIGYTRVCILDSKKCYSVHKDITKRFYPINCIKYLNGDKSLENNSFYKIFNCCRK